MHVHVRHLVNRLWGAKEIVLRILLTRAGDDGRIYLPSTGAEKKCRHMLREAHLQRTELPPPKGYWHGPWPDVLDAGYQLRAAGWKIEIHGGPRTVLEAEGRMKEQVARLEERLNGIEIDLWPKQKEGVLWLLEPGNKLLADECGAGKTIQAILAAGVLKSGR